MGKTPKAPPPPDYVAQAKQQAESQLQLLEAQTEANRPTQVSPFGKISWVKDPETGQWTQTEEWDPQLMEMARGQMGLQQGQQQTVRDLMAQQGKWEGGPEMPEYDPETGEAYSQRFTESLLARVRPEQQEAERQMETRLRLQGLQPGTEAYNRAYQNLLTSHGDVRAQAQLQGLLAGGKEARDIYQTQLAGQQQGYQQSLQDYLMPWQTAGMTQGLSSGSHEQYRPIFQGFQGAGLGQAANTMDAAQQQYADQVKRANDAAQAKAAKGSAIGTAAGAVIGGVAAGVMTGGMGAVQGAQLGAAAGGMAGSYFSDAALKEHIEPISDEEAYNAMLRINGYSFTWPNGKRAAGLIAQEVAKEFPHLVHPAEQGYLKVDYEAFTALLLGAFRHLAKEKENGISE